MVLIAILLVLLFAGCFFQPVTGDDTVYVMIRADQDMYAFEIDREKVESHLASLPCVEKYATVHDSETVYEFGASDISITHSNGVCELKTVGIDPRPNCLFRFRYTNKFELNRIGWRKLLQETSNVTQLNDVELTIRIIN